MFYHYYIYQIQEKNYALSISCHLFEQHIITATKLGI